MTQTKIHIPREHDSLSDIAINGERLLIRFTYNDTFDHWSFGLYEPKGARFYPHSHKLCEPTALLFNEIIVTCPRLTTA